MAKIVIKASTAANRLIATLTQIGKFKSCRVRQTPNAYSGAYTTMHPRQANSFAVVATWNSTTRIGLPDSGPQNC